MFGVIAIVFILMYLNEMYKNRRLEGKINELEDRRIKAIKDRIDREDRAVRCIEEQCMIYKKEKETGSLKYHLDGRISGLKDARFLIEREFKMEE